MIDVSCAFPPTPSTPDHIALAEELGFRRAWCYDSPALYPDVWATLCRAADRTERIGLGPAVIVPSLRHVLVTASAIATLAELAPGRTVAAIGSGFTGRMTLGQRPLRWSDVADYVRALKGLLRGDEVEWEGGVVRMIHPDGFVASRPVDVPILIAAEGPKGMEVAHELGDGVFSVTGPKEGFAWCAVLQFGTVLDDGEPYDSAHAIEAVGHAVVGVYHGFYEWSREGVEGLPGGSEWRKTLEAIPERTRHLALHEGHMVYVTERERPLITADMVASMTFTGTAKALRERLAAMEAGGATEVAIQPGGDDIEGELRRIADMAGLAG